MEAAPPGNPIAERSVAIETKSIGGSALAEYVAVGATAQTLQIGVWYRELAWREKLCCSRLRFEE
jgi:hypothetical protein